MRNHHCRVCGLYNETPPWGEDGLTPTYEICPCCGVESGNEDFTPESTKLYRDKWINHGAKWFDPDEKQDHWDWMEQKKNIPGEFR